MGVAPAWGAVRAGWAAAGVAVTVGLAELIIAKQRNGPTDRLHFVFFERYTRFEEAAPDSYQGTAPGGDED